MVVNSWQFLLFFIVVFLVYYSPWVSRSNRLQNAWILFTSYFFYGFVDWKMLPLLFGVTVVFFLLGKLIRDAIDKQKIKRSSQLTIFGVILGVGLLLYFKYLNFFADSFAALLRNIGFGVSWSGLNIVLPVGVSFFTFKLISYVIEIHREKILPSESLLEFATYISFFPTILSGPIDRPGTFLPQLKQSHHFDFNRAMDGCQQIMWGIFTKMVVADRLAVVTSIAWSDIASCSPWYLIYAALLSPVQVYADFDGYSNMAIGVGKVLGFNITKNFNHPLLARNVSEYWHRWHMSLTSWITDYVFMPLNVAFRSAGKAGVGAAITINLVVIGMWHGASWSYAAFGLYHSLLFLPLILSGAFGKKKKLKEGRWGLPKWQDVFNMTITYLLIAVGHIIFFCDNFIDVGHFFSKIYHGISFFEYPSIVGNTVWLWPLLLFFTDWLTRKKEFVLQRKNGNYRNKSLLLIISDVVIAMAIVLIGASRESSFIYFQF